MSASVSSVEYNPDRALWRVLATNAAAAVAGGAVIYFLRDPLHFSAAQAVWAGVLGSSALVWTGVALVGVALVIRDAFRLPEPAADIDEVAAPETQRRVEGVIRTPEGEDLIVTPSGLHAASWNDESEAADAFARPAASIGRRRRVPVNVPTRDERFVNSV